MSSIIWKYWISNKSWISFSGRFFLKESNKMFFALIVLLSIWTDHRRNSSNASWSSSRSLLLLAESASRHPGVGLCSVSRRIFKTYTVFAMNTILCQNTTAGSALLIRRSSAKMEVCRYSNAKDNAVPDPKGPLQYCSTLHVSSAKTFPNQFMGWNTLLQWRQSKASLFWDLRAHYCFCPQTLPWVLVFIMFLYFLDCLLFGQKSPHIANGRFLFLFTLWGVCGQERLALTLRP